jgi:hypothetical protein
MPFYFCQLANYSEKKDQPGESKWAELREAQLMTLSVPDTGMAVLIDTGESQDIHPQSKDVAGERLARIALSKVYGMSVPCSGPIFESLSTENGKIRLRFRHVEGGLVAQELPDTYWVMRRNNTTAPLVRNSPGSELEGFAIRGAGTPWVWADAAIDGETVLVWSDEIPCPVAVRYAWADNPTCNLYNNAGLPASPFQAELQLPESILFSVIGKGLHDVSVKSVTDDFNRPRTVDARGTNTLSTIGNNWVGTGDRDWRIKGSQLEVRRGDGETFLYNSGQKTLNAAAGTSFTQSVDVAINNTSGSVWGGMVVNLDTNTLTGITFRYNGEGTVQLLNPNRIPITSGEFSQPIDTTRKYRMTISSGAENQYALEIYDPDAAAVMYSDTVENTTSSTSSDGFGGVYGNTFSPSYDDFSQIIVVPEPGTLGLFSVAVGCLIILRHCRN